MSSEIEKIEKIYKCLVSCETADQFNNAFSMFFRYSNRVKPNNESTLLYMNEVENYALSKKKEFFI